MGTSRTDRITATKGGKISRQKKEVANHRNQEEKTKKGSGSHGLCPHLGLQLGGEKQKRQKGIGFVKSTSWTKGIRERD